MKTLGEFQAELVRRKISINKKSLTLYQALPAFTPDVYVSFVKECGDVITRVLPGTDCHPSNLQEMRSYCERLSGSSIGKDDFVFALHQGYEFFFLRDNAVFGFREGERGPRPLAGNLFDFLFTSARWGF